MGDRANIAVTQHGSADRVYLYGHWSGEEMPAILQRALAKRWRWRDGAYLTRIIFCELVKGQEDTEIGFGIATTPPDNEHPILVVNPDTGTVSVEAEPGDPVGRSFSFEEYVALPDVSWEGLGEA